MESYVSLWKLKNPFRNVRFQRAFLLFNENYIKMSIIKFFDISKAVHIKQRNGDI